MKLINWGWYLWPGLVSWLTYTNTPLAPAKQKWSSEGRRGEAGGDAGLMYNKIGEHKLENTDSR